MVRLWWCLPLIALVGCAGVLQGPAENLQAVVAPDPLPEMPVMRPPSQPPPGPTVPPGSFRAWEPPTVTGEGDRAEGRWVTISDTAPAVETLEWDKTIPRAPHTVRPAKSPKAAMGTPPPAAKPATPPPPPWITGPTPGLPTLPAGLPEGLPGLLPNVGGK